jgi:Contractile injection system tube protein/LysM domain
MERVAFLIEQTNERLSCLLNPETLTIRRTSGMHSRVSSGGQLTGVGLSDDPLLYTGGGRTELELDLLFDVTLLGSSVETEDVRTLTAPFWNLSENKGGGYAQPPIVRFIWGKYWNIPGVISAIAERLDYFSQDGAPGRSWLRMRMVRVREPEVQPQAAPAIDEAALPSLEEINTELAPEEVQYHEVSGSDRLDSIAAQYYGDPSYWRVLADFNGLSGPSDLQAGQVLLIPPAPQLVSYLMAGFEDSPDAAPVSFTSLLKLSPQSPLKVAL